MTMSESSGSERRPAKYGDLDLGRVHTAQTVDAFLEMLNLSNLGETFRRANVTSVDHLLRLVPGDLDTMGIRLAGVRVRLQKGLCLLREQQQPEPSVAASPAGSGARGDVPGASVDVTMSPADSSHGTGETVKFNSTSSLYIDSTISNPDMAQARRALASPSSPVVPASPSGPLRHHGRACRRLSPRQICFCVSLLVHDLIQEAEAGRHEMSLGMSSGEQDPFSLFQPRDIFALPGKRSREEFETNAPVELEIPTDHDIRLSIQAIHRLSRFRRGSAPSPSHPARPPTLKRASNRTAPPPVALIALTLPPAPSIHFRGSPGVLVVAMIYIERLRRRVGAELLASTWQPTLLIAIIVAQKVWEDKRYMNVDFTTLCPALTYAALGPAQTVSTSRSHAPKYRLVVVPATPHAVAPPVPEQAAAAQPHRGAVPAAPRLQRLRLRRRLHRVVLQAVRPVRAQLGAAQAARRLRGRLPRDLLRPALDPLARRHARQVGPGRRRRRAAHPPLARGRQQRRLSAAAATRRAHAVCLYAPRASPRLAEAPRRAGPVRSLPLGKAPHAILCPARHGHV